MSRSAQNIEQLPPMRNLETAAATEQKMPVNKQKYRHRQDTEPPDICILSVIVDCHLAVEIPSLSRVLAAPGYDTGKLVTLNTFLTRPRIFRLSGRNLRKMTAMIYLVSHYLQTHSLKSLVEASSSVVKTVTDQF